jgi:DNA repair exonuclease SbcCD ATPase subunit
MQELVIISSKFKNFMSFGNTWNEIKFLDNYTTFIHGENLDVPGSANGCGKSVILQTLAYGLYNKSLTNISLPKLINSTNSIKNTLMEVIIEFTKSGHHYLVHRKRGSETNVQLMCDDEDITLDSINETDILIEQIIGMSFDLFSKIIIFSGSTVPFLDLPISQQRFHIEELFNISILTEKANKLKKLIQNTEGDIKVEEAIIKQKLSSIDAYKKRLEFAEQKVITWENDKDNNITKLKNDIAKVQNIDFDKEQLLFDKKVLLNNNLQNIQTQLGPLKKEVADKYKTYNDSIHEITHLKGNECPYCHQKYETSESNIENLEQLISTLCPEIENMSDEIKNLETEKVNLQHELKEVNSQITYSDLPSLLSTKNNLEHIEEKIKELENSENPHFDTYTQLEQEQMDQIDYDVLDSLKQLKEHQAFLLKLLTDKNSFIRRKIISKTIPFLNARIGHYAMQLGLPHIVDFDDDMSCSVQEFSRELDFGNLSAGEKKRVNLSLTLAFRDVLHHLHAKVNILLVDEIDAGLDEQGVIAVAKLLKTKTKEDNLNTWIIMHRAEIKQSFDRQLIVKKENGFSSFEFANEIV